MQDNKLHPLQILDNIRWIDTNFKGDFYLRYPYIPGCNDEESAIEKFLEFAKGLKKVKEVHNFFFAHMLLLIAQKFLQHIYSRILLKIGDPLLSVIPFLHFLTEKVICFLILFPTEMLLERSSFQN